MAETPTASSTLWPRRRPTMRGVDNSGPGNQETERSVRGATQATIARGVHMPQLRLYAPIDTLKLSDLLRAQAHGRNQGKEN